MSTIQNSEEENARNFEMRRTAKKLQSVTSEEKCWTSPNISKKEVNIIQKNNIDSISQTANNYQKIRVQILGRSFQEKLENFLKREYRNSNNQNNK